MSPRTSLGRVARGLRFAERQRRLGFSAQSVLPQVEVHRAALRRVLDEAARLPESEEKVAVLREVVDLLEWCRRLGVPAYRGRR